VKVAPNNIITHRNGVGIGKFREENMKTYVIGDLQGCAHEAEVLLKRIAEHAAGAHRVLFLGDLVNRGPASLTALRRVKSMHDAGLADTLLGNHDLHLLAVAAGARKLSAADDFGAILGAPDSDALIAWLRQRPLALMADGHLLVHAGVLPAWSAHEAIALADEVGQALRGEDWTGFLRDMYGNAPARWDPALRGAERLRCIVNALTRIRLCAPDGEMDFKEKESAGAPPGSSLLPWFDMPGRQSADVTVVFGHWSALGLIMRPDLVGLDSGCVWGGQLSAFCLQDRALLQVECPTYQRHSGKQGGKH
jgi:bis(5'-nucleosyl)-tetraphosphatase (symmetrical)